jgi:hypothetical protein
MDNLPLSPPFSFFLLKQVKQKTLHSIIEEINYEESMASKDKNSRFNMGKFQGVKVFLNMKASVDDE